MEKIDILMLDDIPNGELLSANDYIPQISFAGTWAFGLEQHFHLEYLQSLTDIKEFRYFSKKTITAHKTYNKEITPFIPDAVIFDYNFKVQDELENESAIEQLINCRMAASLDYNTYRKPAQANFLNSGINKWSRNVVGNAFGCFAGAILVYDFIDNACIGLPITAFSDRGSHGLEEIEYFEDLLKSDFGGAFSNKGRTNPTWYELISDIVILKQKRLIQLIEEGKIIPDWNNLHSLLNGDFCKSSNGHREENHFKYSTSFGKKKLYLDALFINTTPKLTQVIPADLKNVCSSDTITDQEIEIWNFSKDVFTSFIKACKTNLTGLEFKRAEYISDELYERYINDFGDRMELSHLHILYGDPSKFKPLTEEQKEEYAKYEELKKTYNVIEGIIVDPEQGNENVKRITSSILHYRTDKKEVVRLAILHLLARYSIQFSQLAQYTKRKIYQELTDQEIFYMLNPFWNTPDSQNLILPLHINNQTNITRVLDSFKKQITDFLTPNKINKWKNLLGLTVPERTAFFDIESWISGGEKIILKSFFFGVDAKFFPSWLK
jgi:hypothetical protein